MDQSSLIDQNDFDQSLETSMSKRIEPTVSDKLKRSESNNLKQKIIKQFPLLRKSSFIRDVQLNKYQNDKLPLLIQTKISEFEDEFQELWKEPEELIFENGEALERVVMKPLFSKLMPIDATRDKNIEFALKTYNFVQLKHLEIDESVESHQLFQQAVQLLTKIDKFETPKEKMNCIVNACKQVSSIVNQLANNAPTGADNFLPVLIYATLKAQPQRPHSNIQYIGLYRSPKRLTGPDEYYYTAYESTLEFIEQLDHQKLKISSQEFQTLCNERMEGIKNSEKDLSIDGKFHLDAHQNYVNLQMIKMKIQDLQKKSRFYEQSKKQKLKFNQRQLSEISLSEVNEFHSEYNVLLKNLQDMQNDLDNLFSLTENIIKDSLNGNQKNSTKKFFGII